MNETQLQIIISVINEAGAQLAEVGAQLSELSGQTTEAAASMSASMSGATTSIEGSLSAAEIAAADAAQQSADAWGGFADEAETSTAAAATEMGENWTSLATLSAEQAASVSAAWAAQGKVMEESLAATLAEMETETGTAAGEMAEEVETKVGGTMGYFRGLIAGYAMERVGQFLLGGVEDAVNAAASPANLQKLAQLQAEIQQEKAAIGTAEAAMQNWSGTTVEVTAKHQAAAAAIDVAKEKIAGYEQQLGPLQAAYDATSGSALAYDAALQKLTDDWQTHEALVGSTLLPLLTMLLTDIDNIVEQMSVWTEAHPKLTEAIEIFIGVLGGLLVIFGTIVAAAFLIILVVGLLGGAFIAIGAVALIAFAALVAILVTFHSQILEWSAGFTKDWDAFWAGLWNDIKGVWDSIVSSVQGAIATIYTAFTSWGTNIESWWSGLWNGILNTLKSIVTQILSEIAKVTAPISNIIGAVSSAASAVGGAVSSGIKAFASGGIVTSPTLALVGEAGPEAIIPLSAFSGGSSLSGGGIGGGAGSIVININGGSYLNQGGAQQIAAALATMIGQQLKLKIR